MFPPTPVPKQYLSFQLFLFLTKITATISPLNHSPLQYTPCCYQDDLPKIKLLAPIALRIMFQFFNVRSKMPCGVAPANFSSAISHKPHIHLVFEVPKTCHVLSLHPFKSPSITRLALTSIPPNKDTVPFETQFKCHLSGQSFLNTSLSPKTPTRNLR